MNPHDQILKFISHNGPHTCAEVARHMRISLQDARNYLEDHLRWKNLKYNVEGGKYELNRMA